MYCCFIQFVVLHKTCTVASFSLWYCMLCNMIFILHFLFSKLLVSLPLHFYFPSPLSFSPSLSLALPRCPSFFISSFQFPISFLPHSCPLSLPPSLSPSLPHLLPLFLSTSTFFCSFSPSLLLSPPIFVSSIFSPSLYYCQVTWMPLPEGSAPPGCPPGLEYLTQIDQILVHQQI